MGSLDWVIVGFLAWGGATGYIRGFLPMVFRLLSSIGGLLVALTYTAPVVRVLEEKYRISGLFGPASVWPRGFDGMSDTYRHVFSRYLREVLAIGDGLSRTGGPPTYHLGFLVVYVAVFLILFVVAGIGVGIICRALRLLSIGGFILPGNHLLGAIVGLGRHALVITLCVGILTLFLWLPAVNSTLGEAIASSYLVPYFLKLFNSLSIWLLNSAAPQSS